MQRSSRIRCRIPCEIEHEGRRSQGTVVDLSKGGVGIVTSLTLREADPIRIRLFPKRKSGAIELPGIVWSERVNRNAKQGDASLVLGIMLSETPDSYLALLEERGLSKEEEQGPGQSRGEAPLIADAAIRRADRHDRSTVEVVRAPKVDPSLPRAKFPLPPPKQVPEEKLPLFRARIKQVGGSRTRGIKVRARSATEAEQRIRQELKGEWEILEFDPAGK